MIPRLLPLLLAVLLPALAGGDEKAMAGEPAVAGEPATGVPGMPIVADTILRPDLLLPSASVRAGLSAEIDEPHVRLGMRRIRVTAEGMAQPRPPGAELLDPTQGPLVVAPLTDLVLRRRVAELGQAERDVFLPPLPERRAVPDPQEPDRFVTDYADLALNVRSRMELGGDWTRFEPCDARFGVGCNPTLIPQLSPDVQFGVQVDGTILDRIRVDVDFDQSREFDAANRINIFYEGGEDDVLQRLEIGDVTFDLPPSRFLTEGIPAGNFGFQAVGQMGAFDVQTVWAQQRGDLNSRVFQLTGVGDQRAFVQEDTLVLDDADYVRGQFFFLVHPTEIDRYPHIDALELDPASASFTVAPGAEPLQLYRFEDDPIFRQQVEGFIQADAVATDSTGLEVRESGWFRYLQQGVDYYVHPSGLWIALRQPLAREEMLAVTYITAAGDTIGDYNPEVLYNQGERPELRLLKASGANHQPGRPTWDLEMHQVYRVSGSGDVEPGSVDLSISLGELSAGRTFKRRPSGQDITFLRLFGLDEEAPTDELDEAFVYSPGEEFFQDQPPVRGTFVFFPTLRPFADPPPVESLSLTETTTDQILGDDANPRIYFEEDPFERDNAGRFRLTLGYRIRSEGFISSFSLGAFGIRDGSERIFLDDRLLTRGLDYEIDYDVGQVRLVDPDLLFASSPDASVRATWEQRSLFQVTPTQVFGLRTHVDVGSRGAIDLLGLYQSERSVVRRPILGTEPAAAIMGGLSGRYEAPVGWLDRFLEAVPGLEFAGSSSFSASGEIALSVPNPNTQGRGFVDDFDGSSELPIRLRASDWILGSAPSLRDGADAVLPAVVDETTAGSLVWQHRWVIESVLGDSVGVHEGLLPSSEIDQQIRVAGSDIREPGLLLSLGSGPAGPGAPAWRSTMTPLSTNGLDLTKTEFLEFYVDGDEAITLVVDLGTVSEDAFFLDDSGATQGVREDGRAWGLDRLDQEADPRLGEIWNPTRDQLGVWDESCLAMPGEIYFIGDPRANCTAGNGRPDTEDLDQDGSLDTAERHLRYVVTLDGSSPFLARDTVQTGTGFQLYRIPIRGGVEVGGIVSEADLRAVRHLRITATGPAGRAHIARMRLIGSRWIKRNGEGVLEGIIGDTLSGVGQIEVASISPVTEGDAYQSPPGVLAELVDPTQALGGQGIEFNEKSLGISFEDVPAGGRAEVYYRFPQRPQDFLTYRQARLWVVARSGDFGPGRPNYFYFKVGSDPENFYLYRTRLPAPPGGGVSTADWLPEVVVDFDVWLDLRRRAEEQLSFAPRAPGDPPVEVWSADSTYAVVLADRGRAPNLASVRELSLGVWNQTPAPTAGEVWIDELRLAEPVRDAGLASAVNVELDGAGVLTTRVSVTDRGAFFHQLRDDPTYQDDRTVNLYSRLAVDRWLPSEWGLEMPVTFEMSRASQDPVLLTDSDVRADRITDLRDTKADRRRMGASLRKRTQTANPVLGFIVDGLDLRASYTTADASTVTTESDSETFDAGLGWFREPEPRAIGLVPDFAEGAVRAILPGFLEDDVAEAELRLTPERVSLGTSYFQQDARISRFERIIENVEDDRTIATFVPREFLETAAGLRLRPLPPLTADFTLLTVRDLLPAEKAASDGDVQALIDDERWQWQGVDLGWETNRTLRSTVGFRPSVFTWLRSDFDWSTVYRSERNTNFVERTPTGADTTTVLARNARGQRDWGVTMALSPGGVARAWLGDPTEGESPDIAQLRSIISAVQPLAATYRDGITSRFDRDPIDPRLEYQFGLGGIDRYRFIGQDTAASLTDRSSWRLGSGVTLPGGAGIQVSYQVADATTLDTRSARDIHQQTWPEVQATLPTIRPPRFTGMEAVNLTAGIERTTREVELGGRALQRRFDSDTRMPVDLSVEWLRTLVTAYTGSFRSGKGIDPTGRTEREQESHRVSLSSQLLPPSALARRLDRPIRLSLIGAYSAEENCRITARGEDCVAFVDQVTRTASLSADTSAGGFEFGIQVSFDDRQSFVGQQTGSTQFQVGIFGQLDFGAGALPVR